LLQEYHEKREKLGAGEYADVNVLMWREKQARKAYELRRAGVPDKNDKEDDWYVEVEAENAEDVPVKADNEEDTGGVPAWFAQLQHAASEEQ
jgi:hypothetical protein